MRIETVARTVYGEVYVSDDGIRFDNKRECLAHELVMDDIRTKVEKLEVKAMEGYMPCDGLAHNPDFDFKWYKVNCLEDILLINEYYGMDDGWKLNASDFPAVVCVENGDSSAWGYYLENSINYVTSFFHKLCLEGLVSDQEIQQILNLKRKDEVNNE